MTKLRNFGDGKTVVVYTKDRELANRLMRREDCLRVIPYEQEQYSKHKVALVGLYLYFPARIKRQLQKIIRCTEGQTPSQRLP